MASKLAHRRMDDEDDGYSSESGSGPDDNGGDSTDDEYMAPVPTTATPAAAAAPAPAAPARPMSATSVASALAQALQGLDTTMSGLRQFVLASPLARPDMLADGTMVEVAGDGPFVARATIDFEHEFTGAELRGDTLTLSGDALEIAFEDPLVAERVANGELLTMLKHVTVEGELQEEVGMEVHLVTPDGLVLTQERPFKTTAMALRRTKGSFEGTLYDRPIDKATAAFVAAVSPYATPEGLKQTYAHVPFLKCYVIKDPSPLAVLYKKESAKPGSKYSYEVAAAVDGVSSNAIQVPEAMFPTAEAGIKALFAKKIAFVDLAQLRVQFKLKEATRTGRLASKHAPRWATYTEFPVRGSLQVEVLLCQRAASVESS